MSRRDGRTFAVRLFLVTFGAALLLLTTACNARTSPTPARETASILTVENNTGEELAIYTMRSDSPVRRVGTVSMHARATFWLTGTDLAGAEIAFYARGIYVKHRSRKLPVWPGTTYKWTIGIRDQYLIPRAL